MKKLEEEINRLKSWEQVLDATAKVAGWECEYEHWASLYDEFNFFVDRSNFINLSSIQLDEILYLIARDHESEVVMDKCKESLSLFEALLNRIPHSFEVDAKWQFAEAIPELISDHVQAEKILVQLVQDEHEYTSRRALISLSKIKSNRTEEFCIKAWASSEEYQRIAALRALKEVQSALLPEYKKLALEDGRKFVVQTALELATSTDSTKPL